MVLVVVVVVAVVVMVMVMVMVVKVVGGNKEKSVGDLVFQHTGYTGCCLAVCLLSAAGICLCKCFTHTSRCVDEYDECGLR